MQSFSELLCYRLTWAIGIICTLWLCIICYLFYMQVTLTLNFFKLGRRNFLRHEKVISPRGNIVDASGNLLATNRPVTVIYWQGTGQKKLTNEQQYLIRYLSDVCALPDDIAAKIQQAEHKNQRLYLAYDVSFTALSKISEQFPNHKNIGIEKFFKRFYPHKSIGCHIIGYLGLESITEGKMGLELICNDKLMGQAGETVTIINSLGHLLHTEEVKRALMGDTIKTTLELPLQMLAEAIFPEESAGACILLDPKTGALKALVSRPSFDPNIFLDKIEPEHWSHIQEKKCFINRAFNACYPPASLFKLVTISAALEQNLITPTTQWHCLGEIPFAGRLYHCNKLTGHGLVDAHQAIALSCNIPFYEISKKIKIDTLAQYAHHLGLGSRTQAIFKEHPGLIPTSTWKKTVKHEPWWPGETLSATIGQSYLLVTPIQIACMISAFCEGYLVQPRILATEQIRKKPLNLRSETLAFVKKTMKEVAAYGTGRNLNNLAGFDIYIKTGTAQTSDLAKRDLGKEYLEHGWAGAYFSYKNLPPLTLIIIVENVGSSKVATTMAHRFFKAYSRLIESQERQIAN